MFKKKNFIQIPILFLLLQITVSCSAQQIPDNSPIVDTIDMEENLLDSNAAYKQKFDSLSKDGEWIKAAKADFIKDVTEGTGEDFSSDYPSDGEYIYIWRPYCATANWSPYYNGRWVFSSYGWIWMSEYNWGWGPYNYGRWHFSNYYGWIWLPGSVWACNWVTWRCNNYYAGWYPTCPRVYWRHNGNLFTNKKFVSVPIHWIFVNKKDFTKKVDNTTIVKAENNAAILKTTLKVKSSVYDVDPNVPKVKYNGPDVSDISKAAGEKITPISVEIIKRQEQNQEQNQEGKNVLILRDDESKIVREGNSNESPQSKESIPSKPNDYGTKETKSGTTTTKSGTTNTKGTKKGKTNSDDGGKNNHGTKDNAPGKTNDAPKNNNPPPPTNDEGTKGDSRNDGGKGIFKHREKSK